MTLKNLFIFCCLLLPGSLLIAQSSTAFGLIGGVNSQTFNGKDFSGDELSHDMIIGFHAGVNVQIPIAPEFYLQPGLMFTTKGSKNETSLGTTTYNLSYLEMPLNLTFKPRLGNGHLLLGFGPYVGYAVSGKVISESGSADYERDIEFANSIEASESPLAGPYFKHFDAGGNIFAGYELSNGIFFQLNTQLGMLNINPEDNRILTDDASVKNTGFGVSLGYRL